jgi:bifunctional non-homologous end joining protein LigD
VKRLAVQVEDHPVSYFSFKGVIPEGNYGAGIVYRWDEGTFVVDEEDPLKAWENGALKFELNGHRLRGKWKLFKMKGRQQNGKPLWLLQKVKDEFAVSGDTAGTTVAEKMARAPRITKSKEKANRRVRSSKTTAQSVSLEEFLGLRNPKGDLNLEVDGVHLSLTSLDRIYWPNEKITKYELLRYYAQMRDHILPFLENRPAILQRYPKGISEPKFFQHDLENAPAFIKTKRLRNEEGRELHYAVYTSLASLLYFVNLGTIEQHPWNSIVRRLQKPDWIVLDLDPKESPWKNVLKVALTARKVFEQRGLKAFVKTSGSSGIHLYLPLEPKYTYSTVAKFAGQLAAEIASHVPMIATTERSLADREKAQVYVDWLQNARGKSVAAPFTVRAKPKAPVSMPLEWKQIEGGVKITDFTLRNVPSLLSSPMGPWNDFFNSRQEI